MKILKKLFSMAILATAVNAAFAAPMPSTIVVQDKAVVPIVKTQTIQTMQGEQPIRTTEATIFEVSNQGQDIVAREMISKDHEQHFSDKPLSTPVIKKGAVFVPTSKVEEKSTLKQAGSVIAETKQIDAKGIAFKEGQSPTQKELQLKQLKQAEQNKSMSHAVIQENGKITQDMILLKDND